jgi:hypothetical protein
MGSDKWIQDLVGKVERDWLGARIIMKWNLHE